MNYKHTAILGLSLLGTVLVTGDITLLSHIVVQGMLALALDIASTPDPHDYSHGASSVPGLKPGFNPHLIESATSRGTRSASIQLA